jgi:tRNA threonylcarbamoyladenosine biosynthesis protein TsaE
MSVDETVTANSLDDTKEFAQKLASTLKKGTVICLFGELGSGKTYFTKYLCEALGVDPNLVVSPTFVYWREYQGKKFKINHFDFYRIGDSSDINGIGFEEALEDSDSVTIIEWADRVTKLLPKERIEIKIKILDDQKRVFEISRFK